MRREVLLIKALGTGYPQAYICRSSVSAQLGRQLVTSDDTILKHSSKEPATLRRSTHRREVDLAVDRVLAPGISVDAITDVA